MGRIEIKDEYIYYLAQFAYLAYVMKMRNGTGRDKEPFFEDLSDRQKRAWRNAVRASARRITGPMLSS